MPVMQGREAAVGAGGDTGNVLSDEDFEFLPSAALVTVAAVADQVNVRADMKADNQALLSNANVYIESAADRLIESEDMILDQEPVPRGARLSLRFENNSGAAADINWKVKIEFLPGG